MPQLGFKKQFVPMVEDGSKPHTIREKRKVPIYPGDTLFLAEGVRTKQYRLIKKVPCTKVEEIEIHRLSAGFVVFIEGRVLSAEQQMDLIKRDGFATPEEFERWFLPKYVKKFEGVLIWWK